MDNKKYKILIRNKEIEIEQLSNGKFKIPDIITQFISVCTGSVNIDNCRIPYQSDEDKEGAIYGNDTKVEHTEQKHGFKPKGKHILASDVGRFPANLLVSDDILNDGNITKTTPHRCKKTHNEGGRSGIFNASEDEAYTDINDSSSFSRYFDLDKWFEEKLKKLPPEVQKVYPFLIIPKASPSEKEDGLDEFNDKSIPYLEYRKNVANTKNYVANYPDGSQRPMNKHKNFHPTVKPIKLFSYLITLGSRENDIILDPYIGSGTSAISSLMLERKFIGIDNSEEYCKIANERIKILLNYKEGKEAFENSVSDEPFKLKIKEETKMDEDMFL